MKDKALFLGRLVLFSLVTFLLWENFFLDIYFASIRHSVDILYRLLFGSPSGPKALGSTSYYLIPFISMVLAKPGIGFLKRLKAIAVGIAVFLLFDFLFAFLGLSTILVEPALRPDVPAVLSSVLQVLYVTIELSLPFVLWFTLISRDYAHPLGLEARPPASGKEGTFCPICKKEKAGLVDHIRSAHGEKALRRWKVRRVLAKRSLT
jgi:hypothetical protein